MADRAAFSPAIEGNPCVLDRERAIAALAGGQHGVVTRHQLLRLGVAASVIDRWLDRKRLHRLHRGVYAVGHRTLSAEAPFMAAVLAGGPGTVLSHRSAAELWGIRRSAGRRLEVTAPRGRRAGRCVEVHHGALAEDERTVLHRIPVTTASRTLLDLAAVLSPQRLERAMSEAEYRGLWDSTSLDDLLDRYPRRKGTAALRTILADGHTDDGITRSELEDSFVGLLSTAGLPRPRLNRHVRAGDRLFEGDCVWPDQSLIVELDSRSAHGRWSAFESDRARDRVLSVAGWRTIRVTARQLQREPGRVAADLRRLLNVP